MKAKHLTIFDLQAANISDATFCVSLEEFFLN
jgi:hypothetical protein